MASFKPENIYLVASQLTSNLRKKESPPVSPSKKAFFDAEIVQKEAKNAAIKYVAQILQRPDQLDKIEQHTKRIQRKKVMVEALLKSMIQTYLEGVSNGLLQLHKAQDEIQLVKERIKTIQDTYKDVAPLVNKLKDVKEESRKHSQYATAVENLKHIFNVPEIIKKTNAFLNEGKLLHAHQCIMDLENSRDDLLYELHKLPAPNPIDINMIHRYYEDLGNLNEELSKQLLLIADRLIPTTRKEPALVVTMARVIEREERSDAFIKARFDMTGFNPPGRPKELKKKFFQILSSSIKSSLEGTQCEDRTLSNVWLVKHLELIRLKYLDDLRVIKKILPPCFPDQYDIFNVMTNLYHEALSHRLEELVEDNLEGNEIITLLTWIKEYDGRELLGHPDLNIAHVKLPPLLEPTVIQDLNNKYLQNLQNKVQEWLQNTIKADIKDWNTDKEPETVNDIYYHTQMPYVLYDMCKQNIKVAQQVSSGLTTRLVQMLVNQMNEFATMYSNGLREYHTKHAVDRKQPNFYIHYLIAIANNCQDFVNFMFKLRDEVVDPEEQDDMDRSILLMKLNNLSSTMDLVGFKACAYLLDDIFMDLEPHFVNLLTKEWITDRTIEGIIMATFEDYGQDYVHLKPKFYSKLVSEGEIRLTTEYVKGLLGRRYLFKNYEERKDACDKLTNEANNLIKFFEQLKRKPFKIFKRLETNADNYRLYNIPSPLSSPTMKQGIDLSLKTALDVSPSNIVTSITPTTTFSLLIILGEIIKMRDTTLLSLELTTLFVKYKDITVENVIQILLLRGDMTRGEIKNLLDELPAAANALAAANKTTDTTGTLGGLSANLLQATRGLTGRLVGASEKESSISLMPSVSDGHNYLDVVAVKESKSGQEITLKPVASGILQPEKSVFARIN